MTELVRQRKRLVGAIGLVLAMLLLVRGAAAAETAGRQLEHFLQDVRSLLADFEQTLVDESNRETQHSAGMVAIKRPGKFRWDYQLPYQQLIVADGEKLWVYDTDLEQVTVKPN